MRIAIAMLVALLGSTPSARADLEWTGREAELFPQPGDKELHASYEFKNAGDRAVTITTASATCRCTFVTLDNQTLQPGETGALNVTFVPGQRRGLQEKSIRVETDDGKVYTLMLRVHLPEALTMSPRFVFWKLGAPATPRTITIKAAGDPVRVTAAKCASDKLHVELKTVTEGREYTLEITPLDTSAPLMATINLRTDVDVDDVRQLQVYARVIGAGDTATTGPATRSTGATEP